MLVMRPAKVAYGSDVWEGVTRVAIESSSVEMTEEWDDEGPHLMFADSTRRKTSVLVYQDIEGDDLLELDPGTERTLVMEVDRGNDSDARRISVKAVVQGLSYSLSGSRSLRLIRLVAVSSAGDVEPVSVQGGV